MNKVTIQSAYLKIRAGDDFRQKTVALLRENTSKRASRHIPRAAALAASFVIIAGFIALLPVLGHGDKQAPHNSVTIPKMKVSDKGAATASMIAYVVYDGRVYTQTDTRIGYNDAQKILGKKLGTAKGNIDEYNTKYYSGHSKYNGVGIDANSDFKGDIYTLGNYSSVFRIIGIHQNPDGTRTTELFECLNGITISGGNDAFGKLNMQRNSLGLTYVQWSDGKTPIYTVNDNTLMNNFIRALNKTTPYPIDRVLGYPDIWNESAKLRRIRIRLRDGCDVGLTLAKGGYVIYGDLNVAFKMSDRVFYQLWDKLDYAKDLSVKSR